MPRAPHTGPTAPPGSDSGSGGGGDGTTTTGGIPSYTDSGGGGGGGTSKAAHANAVANAKFGLTNLVLEYGIPVTGSVSGLISTAAAGGWSTDRFLYALRRTPEYRQAFPGIMNKNGTMKMTESQYLQQTEQIESIATQAGLNIGPQKAKWLFQHDVSPAEFSVRAEAMRRIRDNPELYRQFNRVVAGGKLTKKEIFRAALGMGNKEWYNTWQDTVTRYQARQSGLRITKAGGVQKAYENVSKGLLEKISDLGLSESEMARGFSELSEHLMTTLGESRVNAMGLTKRQLEQASFGGPKAARVRQKIRQVLETSAAAGEDRAETGTSESQSGALVAGGKRQQAYE